jgi:hypothetical protein
MKIHYLLSCAFILSLQFNRVEQSRGSASSWSFKAIRTDSSLRATVTIQIYLSSRSTTTNNFNTHLFPFLLRGNGEEAVTRKAEAGVVSYILFTCTSAWSYTPFSKTTLCQYSWSFAVFWTFYSSYSAWNTKKLINNFIFFPQSRVYWYFQHFQF